MEVVIREQGNGFPKPGAYVSDRDGELYCVVSIGRIQTGDSMRGQSNWMQAEVKRVPWSECDESDEFPALVIPGDE